jgi:hypothetical protein
MPEVIVQLSYLIGIKPYRVKTLSLTKPYTKTKPLRKPLPEKQTLTIEPKPKTYPKTKP